VDHLIWYCERFETERRRLTDALTELDVELGTPVRDLCDLKKWRAMTWLSFFKDSWAKLYNLGP
jgi:hypothetical protein